MLFQDLIRQNLLFDSHCHLNAKQYDADRGEVVKRAKKAGVEAIIDIGTDVESSKRAIGNAEKYDIVYAAVGIDPEVLIPGSDLFERSVFDLEEEAYEEWLKEKYNELLILAKNDTVLMIGETGIDNYWLNRTEDSIQRTVKDAEKSIQRQEKLFQMHCRVSKEVGKPLSIHSRNAIRKCLEVLESEKIGENMAVFHSLTPDTGDDIETFSQKVKDIRESKYFIGINGIYSFKNAALVRSGINSLLPQEVVIERMETLKILYDRGILVETDGPFLAPEPHRGKRNEPGFIPHIIASIYSTVRT